MSDKRLAPESYRPLMSAEKIEGGNNQTINIYHQDPGVGIRLLQLESKLEKLAREIERINKRK